MKKLFLFAVSVLLVTSCTNNGAVKNEKSVAVTETLSFNVGELNVVWIQDNLGERLMPVQLFANADSVLIDSLGVRNGVPASMSAYLVQVDGKKLLFDTGNGGANGYLVRRLDSLGVKPGDIDYLFITHFHGDHIGGMLDGDSVVFGNAQVYASQMEYSAWIDSMPAERNGMQVKTMQKYADRLHLFNFGDTLPMGVVAIDSKGHTPGHSSYLCGKLLVVGDIMHGASLQLVNPEICASFDSDKPSAITSRKNMLKLASDNGYVMVGMHMPQLTEDMFK